MGDKHPIHTTLSTEAMTILERYEKELGAKNIVLENALLRMNRASTANSINVSAGISTIEIGILKPLVGKLPEGSVIGIIGPPASGKTLLACAIISDFLSSNERQCVFISNRNRLSYLIPTTNSLGMKLGNFAEKMFLDILEINTLDGVFGILQKSKPKIIAIDDLGIIQECGSSDPNVIFNSSAWKILSEEIRNQKAICVVISENETINRFCDIVVRLYKSKNNGNGNLTIVKVVKNIGLISSDVFKLEMNGKIKVIPLLKVEETSDEFPSRHKSESQEPVEKIIKPLAAPSPVIMYRKEKTGLKQTIVTHEPPEPELTRGKLTIGQIKAMKQIRISLTCLNIIRLVISNPGITQLEISRKLKIHQSTVSNILKGFFDKKILLLSKPVGKNIPINPNMEKIKQEFGSLIQAGLLPAIDAPKEPLLQEIARRAENLKLANDVIDLLQPTITKIMAIEQVADKLKTDIEKIKNAVKEYQNSDKGTVKIAIDEQQGGMLVMILE